MAKLIGKPFGRRSMTIGNVVFRYYKADDEIIVSDKPDMSRVVASPRQIECRKRFGEASKAAAARKRELREEKGPKVKYQKGLAKAYKEDKEKGAEKELLVREQEQKQEGKQEYGQEQERGRENIGIWEGWKGIDLKSIANRPFPEMGRDQGREDLDLLRKSLEKGKGEEAFRKLLEGQNRAEGLRKAIPTLESPLEHVFS